MVLYDHMPVLGTPVGSWKIHADSCKFQEFGAFHPAFSSGVAERLKLSRLARCWPEWEWDALQPQNLYSVPRFHGLSDWLA